MSVDTAHQHIDLFITPCVARCQLTADVGDYTVRNVTYGQAEFRGTLLIEDNLNFRVAALNRRLDVSEAI